MEITVLKRIQNKFDRGMTHFDAELIIAGALSGLSRQVRS